MQFQRPSCLETYIDSSVCGQLINKASLIVTLGEEQSNSEVCSQLLNYYSFALELNKS